MTFINNISNLLNPDDDVQDRTPFTNSISNLLNPGDDVQDGTPFTNSISNLLNPEEEKVPPSEQASVETGVVSRTNRNSVEHDVPSTLPQAVVGSPEPPSNPVVYADLTNIDIEVIVHHLVQNLPPRYFRNVTHQSDSSEIPSGPKLEFNTSEYDFDALMNHFNSSTIREFEAIASNSRFGLPTSTTEGPEQVNIATGCPLSNSSSRDSEDAL